MVLPDAAARLVTAANHLRMQRHFLSSYTLAKRALALAPDHPAPKASLGAVLWNMSRAREGKRYLEQAVALVPENVEYLSHLALCYSALGEDDKTEQTYTRAIELAPDDLAIRWNRSNFRLARGDWKSGLVDYETRIDYRGAPAYPEIPFQFWNGEDLNGKTLLIVGEQGVGDTILSSRYIPIIKQRWPDAKLLWVVQPRLHDLFYGYREFIEFIPAGYPWPAMKADYAVFQMSLIGLLGSKDIPSDPGLIRKRADLQVNSWRLPEPHVPSLKIGLSWTGNTNMLSNEVRSVPLEMLMPLAEDPRFTIYSLQVGEGAQHIHAGGANDLVLDCSKDLEETGFAATASMMLNLDLVLTVCTSNAHMAGALGVPCWTMLSHDCYWVWGREGHSTPWYPGMRLFRQRVAGDWQFVVDDVKAALDEFVSARALAA